MMQYNLRIADKEYFCVRLTEYYNLGVKVYFQVRILNIENNSDVLWYESGDFIPSPMIEWKEGYKSLVHLLSFLTDDEWINEKDDKVKQFFNLYKNDLLAWAYDLQVENEA